MLVGRWFFNGHCFETHVLGLCSYSLTTSNGHGLHVFLLFGAADSIFLMYRTRWFLSMHASGWVPATYCLHLPTTSLPMSSFLIAGANRPP